MDDLEMRHLDALAAAGDLQPRRQCGRAKLNAERRTGLSGRNNDDGSLNLKHLDLLNEQTGARPSGRIPGGDWFQVVQEGGSGFHVTFEGIAAWRRPVTRRLPGMHRVCVRTRRSQTLR